MVDVTVEPYFKFKFLHMFRLFTLLFLFLVLFFNHCLTAQAQFGDGVGLRPAFIEETMDTGQRKEFTLVVSNSSDQDKTYYLYKKDIVNASDSGVPIFADDDAYRTKSNISEWITFVLDTIDIPAHSSIPISFTVTVPESASRGTHFAGIFVSMQPTKLQHSGMAVGYEVVNIISIRVAGVVEERANIRQFSTDNYIYNKSEVTFNIKVENNGKTLLRPTGTLVINNIFGKQVGIITFNGNLAGVFPGSTREFAINWINDDLGLGRYEAIISSSFGEDGFKQTTSSSVTFWILPMKIVVPSLCILLTLLLATYTYIGAKIYANRELAFYTAGSETRRLLRRHKRGGTWIVFFVLVIMFLIITLFSTVLLVIFA